MRTEEPSSVFLQWTSGVSAQENEETRRYSALLFSIVVCSLEWRMARPAVKCSTPFICQSSNVECQALPRNSEFAIYESRVLEAFRTPSTRFSFVRFFKGTNRAIL